MKINAKILFNTLEKHLRFCDAKHPQLGNVYLEAVEGRLLVQTGNARHSLTSELECEGEIKTALDCLKLKAYLQGTDEDLDLTAKEEKFYLKGKTFRNAKLNCGFAENYPLRKYNLSEKLFSLPAVVIKNAYKRLIKTVDDRDLASAFDFVYLKLTKDKLLFASTNSFEISKLELAVESSQEIEFKIPKDDFTFLFSLAAEGENIEVWRTERNIVYKIGNALFEGYETTKNFPNFAAPFASFKDIEPIILPASLDFSRHFLCTEALNTPVLLRFEENQIISSSLNKEGEEQENVHEIIYSGKPFELYFNLTYLDNFLSAISGKIFYLYFDKNAPTKIMLAEEETDYQKIFGLMKKTS